MPMHRFQRWRDVLQVAPNTATVGRIVDDYVDTIAPLFESLPAECQRALTKPIDVQGAAVTLLQAELSYDGSDDVRDALHEIAHTLAAASGRLTSLHGGPFRAAD